MKHFFHNNKQGFALLYTVVIVSLILTIAISISNTSYKQTVLSSLAKDSQIAFYQADAGAECALYYDITLGQFPFGTTVAGAPATIACGLTTMELDGESFDDYFVYTFANPVAIDPCFTVVIDKVTDPSKTTIDSRGNNRCGAGPRQVERAVRLQY